MTHLSDKRIGWGALPSRTSVRHFSRLTGMYELSARYRLMPSVGSSLGVLVAWLVVCVAFNAMIKSFIDLTFLELWLFVACS
jgi:hypothetical protein